MTTTKLQQKNTNVKYIYDYPDNRVVAKFLTVEDKQQISFRTGYTISYIREWCRGTRRNKRINDLARQIMRLNIYKQKRIEKLSVDSSRN